MGPVGGWPPAPPGVGGGGGNWPPGGGGGGPLGDPCSAYGPGSNNYLICQGCLAMVGGLTCDQLEGVAQLACYQALAPACVKQSNKWGLYDCASSESCGQFAGDPTEGPDCCDRKCSPCMGAGGEQTREYLECTTACNRDLDR